ESRPTPPTPPAAGERELRSPASPAAAPSARGARSSAHRTSPGNRRRGGILVGTGLVVVVIGVRLARLLFEGGDSGGRQRAWCPVDRLCLPALHLPSNVVAQYAQYKEYARASGGGKEFVYLVAANENGQVGVWGVDHDPGQPAPHGETVII